MLPNNLKRLICGCLVSIVLVVLVLLPEQRGAAQTDSLGILSIPSVGVNEYVRVLPIVDRAYAPVGPGVYWLSGTDWIYGNLRVGLAGHNPGIFSQVPHLESGSLIVITGERGAVSYTVTEKYLVGSSDWQVLVNGAPDLVLITCQSESFRWVIVAVRE